MVNDRGFFDGDSFIMEENGEECEYDILFTFENEEETEKYVVYTDNSLDEEGKVRVFASKYNPAINENGLVAIETDEEWKTISELLEYAVTEADKNKSTEEDNQ